MDRLDADRPQPLCQAALRTDGDHGPILRTIEMLDEDVQRALGAAEERCPRDVQYGSWLGFRDAPYDSRRRRAAPPICLAFRLSVRVLR